MTNVPRKAGLFNLEGKYTRGIVENHKMVLMGQFNSFYFSKFINYMSKNGIVMVGTNISKDEYYVCATKDVIYYEAERLAIKKYNYKTGCQEIFLRQYVDEFDKNYVDNVKHKNLDDVFSESEIIFLMDVHLKNIPIHSNIGMFLPFHRKDENIIPYLIRKGVINYIYPLHNQETVQTLWMKTKSYLMWPTGDDMCPYFGEEIAFYFEWMSFYLIWLLFPAGVGALIFILTLITRQNTDSGRIPFLTFYAVIVLIWGFIFTKVWNRRQSLLSFQWDTVGRSENFDIRPSYKDYSQNENVRSFFSLDNRRVRFLLSIILISLMALLMFFLTICSFNLRGFISKETHTGLRNIFFMPSLNKYSQKQAIFDSNGLFFWVPIMMHTTMLYVINSIIFKNLAEKLTEWENYKTEKDYEFFLILKRFFFDSFDSYSGLFYFAFYELDFHKLRIILHSLFISDAVRHAILKCILPWIFLVVKYKTDIFLSESKAESRKSILELWNSAVTPESYMEVYNSFDDYLGMVIEFGYVSIFASVSLVPGIIALISNFINLKTNSTKLLFLFKRPRVNRVNGTGSWSFIISFLTFLSVMTNTFIFGITSEQMAYWAPDLFRKVTIRQKINDLEKEFVKVTFQTESGHVVLGWLIFIEHVFLFIGLIIYFLINAQPKSVRREINNRKLLMIRNYIQTLENEKAQRNKS